MVFVFRRAFLYIGNEDSQAGSGDSFQLSTTGGNREIESKE